MYDELFSPIQIRGMKLENRIILPAMGTKFSRNRHATQQMIDFHVARTRGGAGLNIIEVASVHKPSAPDGFLALCDDEYIPTLKELTDAIHEAGGNAGIQLWQGNMNVMWDPAARIMAPSEFTMVTGDVVEPMTLEDIEEVIQAYGDAARRAAEAGFDCVEFHAAHNYLPHCFLSPAFNRRDDRYGGPLENRMRFGLECIEAIRRNLPEDMPLIMRIDVFDDELENGLTMDEVVEFCVEAGKRGVDVLSASRGNTSSNALRFEVPPIDIPRAYNMDNVAELRRRTGMLTIGAGRINDPDLAERILETGKADLVCIGRAQIADPDFCNKAKEGRVEDIVRCVGCNQGCYDGFTDFSLPFITCLRNPLVGHEGEEVPGVTDKPLHVVIAGGGMGGMQAAYLLAQQGHQVDLYEKADGLGGQFLLAGEAPRKEEMKTAALEMAAMVRRSPVQVHCATEMTPEMITELQPDVFVNAIGAAPITPGIMGVEKPYVKQANDILSGAEQVAGNVAVIGGGLVGIEVAEYLAERGCRVTVYEMASDYGADLGILRRMCVDASLAEKGIDVRVDKKVNAITDRGVYCEAEGWDELTPADYVVIAIGSASLETAALAQACKDAGVRYFEIGDAKAPRRAIDAIREAYEVAAEI